MFNLSRLSVRAARSASLHASIAVVIPLPVLPNGEAEDGETDVVLPKQLKPLPVLPNDMPREDRPTTLQLTIEDMQEQMNRIGTTLGTTTDGGTVDDSSLVTRIEGIETTVQDHTEQHENHTTNINNINQVLSALFRRWQLWRSCLRHSKPPYNSKWSFRSARTACDRYIGHPWYKC